MQKSDDLLQSLTITPSLSHFAQILALVREGKSWIYKSRD